MIAQRRVLLFLILGFAWSAGCALNDDTRSASAGTTAETATRPNVIVFLVDDLGWQDTSEPFHTERTPFNERYHTPNVERLAARGVKFTNAYAAAPVCTPTRTSLMTGRSPAANRITYWTLHRDQDTSTEYPGIRPPAWNVNGLQEDDVTLPRLLQRAGYRTIHVGKAHFGAIGTSGADPTRLGFDVNIAGHGPGAPGSYYGEHDFAGGKRRGDGSSTVWDVPDLDEYHGSEVYLTEALAIEASAAVRSAVADGLPFYLNFAPYAVHTPIMANRRLLDRYGELETREAAYATMIESVDAALGTLLDLVDDLGVADDTIVVYASDNGGLSAHSRDGEPHTHNAPLRSGKGSWYEGGVRVPQIIAWPGVTDDARRCDVPVITYDLFPTILSWANVSDTDAHRRTVEGLDLATLLRAGEATSSAFSTRTLAWHQPHAWGARGPGIQPFTSIRRGDWKLIFRHADRGFELYDLAHDIGEAVDLAGADPQRVRELASEMSAWFERVDAQRSIDTESRLPIGLPSEYAP